jgi:hypothetical protein
MMRTLTPLLWTWDDLPVGTRNQGPADPSVKKPDGTVARCAVQVAPPDSIEVIDSVVRPGRRAARITHHAGVDPINSTGERCEWADFRPLGSAREDFGTQAWYALAITLDPRFIPPTSWGIIRQLHHASDTGSPPWALRVDRVLDPDNDAAGSLWIAHRDTPTGLEQSWNLAVDVPLATIALLMGIRWGGEPGTTNAGSCEVWGAIGPAAMDRSRPDAWRMIGKWSDTTFFGPWGAYWKGGFYTGERTAAVIVDDGMMRAGTMDEARQFFAPSAKYSQPNPTPAPDPCADVRSRLADVTRRLQDAEAKLSAIRGLLS